MRFLRERKFVLSMAVVLTFSAIMALRQYHLNYTRHAELREALIYLHDNGRREEAEHVYNELMLRLYDQPTDHLAEDFRNTLLAEPTNESPSTNIVVRYNRALKKEIEKRFQHDFLKGRKPAEPAS